MDVIKKTIDFKPRDYQLYYLKKALETNVIICLGTGSGKTYITIMLLKEYGDLLLKFKKKAIFLAPTTPLVVQQTAEIKKHTIFNVKTYYGDLGVDTWDRERWISEIDSNHVLTLTPDIFYTLITKKILELNEICCLIFDEAHHACLKRKGGGLEETNHVYKKIMKFIVQENYHNKIRIIGTTASVVNSCVDIINLPACFDSIEQTYNARILGEFEFDPRFLAEPYVQIWLFKEEIFVNEQYCKLFEITNELDKIIKHWSTKNKIEDRMRNMLQIQDLGYLAEKPLLKPKYVRRMIRDIWEVQIELGVYPAYLVCLEFKKDLERSSQSIVDQSLLVLINISLIFLKLIEQAYERTILKLESVSKEDSVLNLTSSKLCRLLDVIHQYYEQHKELTCLVFVDRVLFSFAISKYLEALSNSNDLRFAYIKPNFFVGHNNEYLNFKFIKDSVRNFRTTMNDFKKQKFNILTTTAVLEEGIDIGKCNLVIRFNDIRTYREFVQSKGRARANNSFYVIIHDNLTKLQIQSKIYKETENYLKNKFKLSKTAEFNKPILQNNHQIADKEENLRSKTNALMTLADAGPFMTRYLIKKGNKDYEPEYTINENTNGYQVTLNLKGVTPLKNEVVGKIYLDKMDAVKSAFLEACRQLYEMGQLDDHFIPITKKEIIEKCNLIKKDYSESEELEAKLLFQNEIKQRYFFEKKINDYSFFKEFCKSTYDLYEIKFITDDKYLIDGNEKLGLLTELKLNDDCINNTVYSSKYTAEIQLNLIKKDIVPTDDQLNEIGKFTYTIFESTIASLKKRKEDVKFELEKCIFKFVFLNGNQIDFESMNSIANFNNEKIKEGFLDDSNYRNRLVKTIHTNVDYKIINTNTNVYPSDSFSINNGDKISFNDYFKKRYDLTIEDQKRSLVKVDKANLNQLYSIFMEKQEIDVVEDKELKFETYLPLEFLVFSALDKHKYKKFNCLPPLIYRIKQKIILKNFQKFLTKEILNSECEEEGLNIFNNNKHQQYNNIDEFIKEIFKKKKTLPYFDDESDSSNYNSDDDNGEENSVENDLNAEKQFKKVAKKIIKSSKDKNQEEKILSENQCKIYKPSELNFLDKLLNENLNSSIKDSNFTSVDDFIVMYTENFEQILESMNQKVSLKNFQDIEPKDELKNHNFNNWVNDNSNQNLISMSKLLEALTTKSAMDAVDLERLEFLGDLYLKLVTCSVLFHEYRDGILNDLDVLKTRAVCNKNLYAISRKRKFSEYIFSDNFDVGFKWLPDGFSFNGPTPNIVNTPVTIVDSKGFRRQNLNLVDRNLYQELKSKRISDSIEGLIGAVLVSSGLRNACLFLKYLNVYSSDYHFTIEHKQSEWFRNYDPLENDRSNKLLDFTKAMYAKHDLKSLELSIDYNFENKSLLIQAFKHVSFHILSDFPSYEKLEFLGDAVIDYLIGKFLYDDKANFSPGQLSLIKQSLVNNSFFGTLTIKYGLDKYLLHSSNALFNKINDFKTFYDEQKRPKGDVPVLSNSSVLISNSPEDIIFDEIEPHKALALMGAIFVDSHFDLNKVWNVLHKFMIQELILFKISPPINFIQQMYELYPDLRFGKPKIIDLTTEISVIINGVTFYGRGVNKQMAKLDCAKRVVKDHMEKIRSTEVIMS